MLKRDHFLHLLAAVACVVALRVGLDDVRGLEWPYDGDHYRDIAQAQATRDGHPLADPHYPDELIWYNPLVPWLVAGGSAATRTTPAAFHVQGGPWLNLLAPIAFYVVGVELAGSGAAFAGLIIFLFFNCRGEPALVWPTYSPWLFVATFAQGLFYLSVWAMNRAVRAGTDLWAAAVGGLAGLTFLAHTAPALVLGLMALALFSRRALAIAGIAALIVASPFLYSIVGRYHLAVLNDTPMAWQWQPLTLGGLPGTLRQNAWMLLIGIGGLVVVRSRLFRVWLAAAALLYVYGLTRDLFPTLPAFVPAFHFWRYAFAALTLAAGAALWWCCQRLPPRYAPPVAAAIAAAAVLWMLPQYRTRFDFVYGRAIALERDPTHAQMTAFLHKSTPPDSVILGSRGASLQIIGPAGRHVVAVNANWSNPYVEISQRVSDREAMLDALKTRDRPRFDTLANRYHVTHIVGADQNECGWIAANNLPFVYAFGNVCLYERR